MNTKAAKKVSDALETIRTQLSTQMKAVDEELSAYDSLAYRELYQAFDLISLARLKIRKVAELGYSPETLTCTNHFTDGSKIFPNKKCCDKA